MSSTVPLSTACHNCGAPPVWSVVLPPAETAGPLDPFAHDYLHGFTHEMFHVDGRIFRSVRKLVSSPGFLGFADPSWSDWSP